MKWGTKQIGVCPRGLVQSLMRFLCILVAHFEPDTRGTPTLILPFLVFATLNDAVASFNVAMPGPGRAALPIPTSASPRWQRAKPRCPRAVAVDIQSLPVSHHPEPLQGRP